jgi:transposase
MQPEQLFGMALGIVSPWEVKEITFSKESNRLDIYIDFQKGAQFPCPVCGKLSPVHDTTEKEWRHLNFFQYEAYLHARVPRVTCCNSDCGVKQVSIPWARSGSGFTLLFEALVMTMARDMPVNVIARLLTVNDKRLWRIISAYVDAARSQEDFSQVSHIGIDETSVRKGHKYVSFFFDLARRKLLFGTEGKDHATISRFVSDLQAHGGKPEQITDAAIDMSKAFIKGIQEQLPNAVITFDKFHLIKLMNDALAKIRAEEAREFPEFLKKSRYLFLKNPEDLQPEEQERLDSMIPSRCHKSIEAYIHKLNLQNVYFAQSRKEASGLLHQWHKQAVASTLAIIQKVAKTVKEHWNGILSHFDNRLTTGFLEGINSLIQSAKARARGYRNPQNMITMAYLIAGKLSFNRKCHQPT